MQHASPRDSATWAGLAGLTWLLWLDEFRLTQVYAIAVMIMEDTLDFAWLYMVLCCGIFVSSLEGSGRWACLERIGSTLMSREASNRNQGLMEVVDVCV